jgi:protein-glutamine gamma-glutamyltransferase
MDLAAVKRLRCTLTLHFAVIACLTAMLVATGSQSIFLPVFIFFVSLAAYIFVDRLEWFELGKIGGYIGMLVATVYSIFSYLYNAFSVPSESGQLLAIAGLLVYPEAVLFLQAKNLRIFEQLAVFLLLEMIVAALVNDNILFGVLLAPIMLLWVSALFLFSRYATIVQLNPDMEKPTPILFEIMVQHFRTKLLGDSKKLSLVTSEATLRDVQASRGWRRTMQSFPIGLGAIVFAAFFFYLMPRTAPSSFEPTVSFDARVGLPKSLSIGRVGRLLADPTPVMRVTLTHANSGATYAVREAPYIRARVMDTYGSSSRDSWAAYSEWSFAGIHDHRRLRGLDSAETFTDQERDEVKVEFDIKRKFAGPMYCFPPTYALPREQSVRLSYDTLNLVLEELDPSKLPGGKSLVYQVGSTGFFAGNQLRIMPASVGTGTYSESRNIFNMTRDFRNFHSCNEYREQLLAKLNVDLSRSYQIATAIEQHFGNGEFSYTLDLRPPIDPDLDPIEDFLINQKRGHCQYFASAMVMMLRQSQIPARIVVGYRPNEFNKIGRYFPVRQSDAHAWVEALLERTDLIGTEHEPWLSPHHDLYWVRFDPTAFVEGEGDAIVEQQGQAMDYAEKLWKDYVVEGQKLAGENTLYAPVAANSKNAYDQMVERLQNLRQNLEQGRLFGSGGGIGFAWPLTILIIVVGFSGIVVWRTLVLLPRLAPQLARRLGIAPALPSIQQAFFARCMKLLSAHGYVRQADETPSEFTQRASAALALNQANAPVALDKSLGFLTQLYYRLRFSQDPSLSTSEQQQIDQALEDLSAIERRKRK